MIAPAFTHLSTAVLAATTQPTPMPTVDPKDVTPGPVGFAAIFLVAVLAILLIVDMARRVRRVEYRNRVAEERGAGGDDSSSSDPRPGAQAPDHGDGAGPDGNDPSQGSSPSSER